jgi:hypothetical protein
LRHLSIALAKAKEAQHWGASETASHESTLAVAALGTRRDAKGRGLLGIRCNATSEKDGAQWICAPSDDRKCITRGKSCGSTQHVGSASGMVAQFSGVSMIVGSTQLTLMFFGLTCGTRETAVTASPPEPQATTATV